MTLAAILLSGIFWTASAPPLGAAMPGQSPPQAVPADTPAKAPETQEQPAAPQQTVPADAKPSSPSSPPQAPAAQHRATAAKRPRHKKKTSSPCSTAPASPSSPASGSGQASTVPADPSSAASAPQTSATPPAPKPCAPPKIIVRKGGTSEPSIQLAGSPGNNEAGQRDVVNQLLGITEGNLKKIAGRQLTGNQQDIVTQARQFMGQSKAAMAEGNFERARTLAWKAELLSEDLVKPAK